MTPTSSPVQFPSSPEMRTIAGMKNLLTILPLLLLGCSSSGGPAETFVCVDGAVSASPCHQDGTGGSSATGGQTSRATGGNVATGGPMGSGGAIDDGGPDGAVSTGGAVATGGSPGTGGAPQCGTGHLYCGGACKTCPAEPSPTGVAEYCASDGTCQIRCAAPYTSASYGYCSNDPTYAGCCWYQPVGQVGRQICGCG